MLLDRPISVDLPVGSFEIKIFENCRGMFGSEIQHAVIDGNIHLPARAHDDLVSCAHGHDQYSNRKITLRRRLFIGRMEVYIDMANVCRDLAAPLSTNLMCAAKIILDVNDTRMAAVKVKRPDQGQVFDLAGGATIPLSCDAPRQLLPSCSSSNCSKQQPASNSNRILSSRGVIDGASRGPQPFDQHPGYASSASHVVLSKVPITMGRPLSPLRPD